MFLCMQEAHHQPGAALIIATFLYCAPLQSADKIVDVSLISDILAAIRRKESGSYAGDYTAKQGWGGSSASGAYQITTGTWNNYGGYRRAADAPKSVQDAFATREVSRLLDKYNGQPEYVFGAWYVGEGTLRAKGVDSNYVPPNNKESIRQYVQSALGYFGKGSGYAIASPGDS